MDEYLFGPPVPIRTSTIDLAIPGSDRTIWYCSDCGVTNYPCNHVKDAWKKQRSAHSAAGDGHG